MSDTEVHSILHEDGSLAPGAQVPEGMDDETIKSLHRWMLQQRTIDDMMLLLQRQGRIGFYGPCTGQEAAVFGSGWAFEARDWVLPALREGGVALLRGYSLEDYLAQCFGNARDVTLGRQMPCHYGSRDANYATLSSPIGTQLPHAVGVAWAMKIRKEDAVCAAYMGDGATSENDFHTSLLMATRAALPVVFICQNNQWAISVPFHSQTASQSVAIKACAYGLPGVCVDGNDVFAVYDATREAVVRARAGEGPTLVEALTYRMGAHSTSDDPSRYRDESVTEAWKERDPIRRLERFMAREGIMSEEACLVLADALAGEVRAVLSIVESAAPSPPLMSMFDDVYAERAWFLEEQASEAATFHASETSGD